MVGFVHDISAPAQVCVAGEHHDLANDWPSSLSAYHASVPMPTSDTTQTINYVGSGTPCRVILPTSSAIRINLGGKSHGDVGGSIQWYDTSGRDVHLTTLGGTVADVSATNSIDAAVGDGWLGRYAFYAPFYTLSAPGGLLATSEGIEMPYLSEPWALFMVMQAPSGMTGTVVQWSESLSVSLELQFPSDLGQGWGIYVVVHDGTGTLTDYVNGVAIGSPRTAVFSAHSGPYNAMPHFSVGSSESGSATGHLDVAAVLLMTGTMDTATRVETEDYLIGECVVHACACLCA